MSEWTLEGDYADALEALHKPVPGPMMPGGVLTTSCNGHGGSGGFWTEWPCPTAKLVYTQAEIERTTT